MASISINLKQGTLQPKAKPIVGIDLGTTHSLVAFMDRQTGKPVVLKKKDHHALVPSVIHFSKDGKILVGEAAKQQRVDFPERTINSVKRLMGKSYGEVNQHGEFGYTILDDGEGKLVRVNVDERYYTPIELSALILKELKQMAEDILGEGIEKAVITVPAYFNDAQRQAVKDAGKLAGLEVMRIINEPTAAGLAYGIGTTKEDSRIIAVYDMGGGTFDISILRITGGIFEVLATKGDTHLGGDDIDISIAKYWKNRYGLSATLASLHIVAEQAKKALSAQKTFVSQEMIEGKPLALDSQTLAELMRPWVDKTRSIAGEALQDSGVHREDIETILMVGGSTRSPLIRDAVKDFFGKPVDGSIDPDEVVALGAAVQADILAGTNKEDLLLLDVTPLSLGIETMGGLMDVLMTRNTSIPNHSSRTYTTQKDGQTHMRIAIFQGEREMVSDNRKLGEFTLSGIPPMPAGLPKVHIRFVIDADGILSVSAQEERSGIEQHITVQPQYGLSPQAIEQLLASSIAHAKEDMMKRAHIEARVEAIQLVEVTQQFLEKNDAFLTEEEKRGTRTLLDELDTLLKTDADKGAMFSAMDRLNAQTKPFAERLMNVAIKASLEGKTLD